MLGKRFKALVIDYHLLAGDVASALEAEGAFVRKLFPSSLTAATLQQAVADLQPAFVFSINHSPELAFLCGHFQVPYVTWTIDPLPLARATLAHGTDPSRCLSYVHQRSLVSRLQSIGLGDVRHLPLAASRRRHSAAHSPQDLDPYTSDISFVGGSLATESVAFHSALQQTRCPNDLQQQLGQWLDLLAAQAGSDPSFAGVQADTVPDWLCLDETTGISRLAWLELLNGHLGALHRQRVIEALAPLQICVYGDDGWRPVACKFRGLASHGDELTAIYRASTVNLDIPRLYQREIITLRAFDVMAAGGLLLTESGGDLARMAGEQRLCVYDTTSDLLEKAQALLANPTLARSIADNGKEWVIKEHLVEHRVATILDGCRARGFV